MGTFPVPVFLDAAGYPSDPVVVIVGITLVFMILLLLTLIISVQGRFFDALEKKRRAAADAAPAPAPVPAPAPAPVIEDGIPAEVVAVIAAAVASMDGGKYTLRTLTRAKNGRGAWGNAGVSADTEPF